MPDYRLRLRSPCPSFAHLGIAVGIAGSMLASPICAAQSESEELAALSLEALTSVRVTSVSKRAEPLADAAASVFVIAGESIRRAGVTALPEALRLAPNLQVARVDAAHPEYGAALNRTEFERSVGVELVWRL